MSCILRAICPVFCVLGAGANITDFIHMAAALGEQWPIHGLQPRGSDNSHVPHTTVPAAARAYLHAIAEVYPEGSLHLLGHSFGGWVVFEMALGLCAAGRKVVSVTLIDVEAPNAFRDTLTTGSVMTDMRRRFKQSNAIASLQLLPTDNLSIEPTLQRHKPPLEKNSLAFLQYTSGFSINATLHEPRDAGDWRAIGRSIANTRILYSRPIPSTGPCGRDRRAIHRRRWCGPRVPQSTRTDRRAVFA